MTTPDPSLAGENQSAPGPSLAKSSTSASHGVRSSHHQYVNTVSDVAMSRRATGQWTASRINFMQSETSGFVWTGTVTVDASRSASTPLLFRLTRRLPYGVVCEI